MKNKARTRKSFLVPVGILLGLALVWSVTARSQQERSAPGSSEGQSAAALAWHELSPAGMTPAPRAAASAIYASESNKMVVFGGATAWCGASTTINDVWVLKGANGQDEHSEWMQVSPAGESPAARRGHTAVYSAATDTMVVFGGASVACPIHTTSQFSDVWLLKNATGRDATPTWARVSARGDQPPERSGHSAIYDSENDRMVIAGGAGANGPLNDVWVLANATGNSGQPRWIQLRPEGESPAATASRAVVYDPASNRMTVFGGWNCCGGPASNAVSVLTNANGLGETARWIQLQATGRPPSPRVGSTAVLVGDQMAVFGGETEKGPVNEVWLLDHANGLNGTPQWVQGLPSGIPPAARGGSVGEAAVAFDENTGRVVVFGGRTSQGLANDEWALQIAAEEKKPELELSPMMVMFGATPKEGKTVTVTVKNNLDFDVTINKVNDKPPGIEKLVPKNKPNFTKDFEIKNDKCSGMKLDKNGGTCTFDITFKPSTFGKPPEAIERINLEIHGKYTVKAGAKPTTATGSGSAQGFGQK